MSTLNESHRPCKPFKYIHDHLRLSLNQASTLSNQWSPQSSRVIYMTSFLVFIMKKTQCAHVCFLMLWTIPGSAKTTSTLGPLKLGQEA
jgi:hypothetical protein